MAARAEDTDEELLEAWRDRADREALEAFFKRLMPFAYSVARTVAGGAAEGAVQDAFVLVMRRAATFRPGARVRPWLARIVVNAAAVQARGEARSRRREESAAAEPRAAAGAPEAPVLAAEAARALERAVGELPADERLSVVLHYQHGLTQVEVAEALNVSERTVIRRLERALDGLRRSLAAAGFAGAGSAAVIGALGSLPGEAVPATLAAKVSALAGSAKLGGTLGAGTAAAAAKGGIAMKVFLGVVLAGALAGGAALFFEPTTGNRQPATNLASPPAQAGPAKGLTYEHYAFACYGSSLDGPRREAMGAGPGPLDADFNCYLGGRCIRASDDRVVTFAGGYPSFGQEEGPAAFLPRISPARGTGYGLGIGGMVVKGLPWKGGDKGCLYYYSDSRIMKVWRNPDKGGRWWSKVIAGPGKTEVPGGRIYQCWALKDNKVVLYTASGFYEFAEADGNCKFACLLKIDSLQAQLPNDLKKCFPTEGWVDTGGNYYLCYYYTSNYSGKEIPAVIVRVSPDGTKVEPYVTNAKGAGTGHDGPGLQTGWFCGPHAAGARTASPWYPPGLITCGAHDESTLRRVVDGRVSTLYEDGEWREAARLDFKNQVDGASGLVYGANGWALAMTNGEGKSHKRGEGIYLIKGIDMGKPTVAAPGK